MEPKNRGKIRTSRIIGFWALKSLNHGVELGKNENPIAW
jgi:hypothetical protein